LQSTYLSTNQKQNKIQRTGTLAYLHHQPKIKICPQNNEPITTPVLNLTAAVHINSTVEKAEPVKLRMLWQQKKKSNSPKGNCLRKQRN